MKKTLIAAAVLSMSGAAFAQTNVTLFGIVDAVVAVGNGSLTDRTRLHNSGFNSSRFGVQGVEDLGGGLRAGFWLEAGVNNDDGTGQASQNNNQLANPSLVTATGAAGSAAAAATGSTANPAINARNQGLTFNRRSVVSLGGSWGQINAGRDYTPHFWNHTAFDPFGTNGVGTSLAMGGRTGGETSVRASNSIAYAYGYGFNGAKVFGTGGLNVDIMYYMGENASGAATSDDGRGTSARIGYAGKNWNVAVGSGKTDYATGQTAATAPAGEISTTNIGGNYNLGVANIMGLWNEDDVNGTKKVGMLIGATAPMGQGLVRASYSTTEVDVAGCAASKQIALGYVHNLSKRTQVYATYARVTNDNGANFALNASTTAANASSSGMDFGIKHNF
jgi:predicted porin